MNRQKFTQVVDDLFYYTTLADIKVTNEMQDEFSMNTMLYRKIICKESGKHTISSIAKLLNIATTAVTQKVNELEKKGAIVRKQCTTDKRISYLHKVDKACPCNAAFCKRNGYVSRGLEATYSEEELEKFLDIFTTMNKLYQEFDETLDQECHPQCHKEV